MEPDATNGTEHIGIDLGTTNTVAVRNGDVCEVSDHGRRTLPSVVAYLPNGATQVGELARRRRAIDSANTIYSSKRIIGRRFDSHEVNNFRDRYPFQIEEIEGGWPAFRTRAGLVTPVQVAARVLEALVERTGLDPADAEVTLTVPASFAAPQRRATVDAAAAAGLGEVELLTEPEATARAYRARGTDCRNVFVYDLGGGTFDCAVLDCSRDRPALLSHASDLLLGGDDVDHRLAEHVVRLVMEKHNWDLSNYSEVYDRLLAHCERAKVELSGRNQAEFLLAQVDPECPAPDEPVVLTRTLLDGMCHDLLQRSFTACDAVLRDAKLHPKDIDAVFLAGGTTWLPVVQDGVEAYFGRCGDMDIDPIEVVALGACVESGARSAQGADI